VESLKKDREVFSTQILAIVDVGAAFSRDKPSLAPLIAAKSRSHNQKAIISKS